MKKIVLGILIGFSLACTTSVFADNIKQYILTKINYPIIVNGTEYSDAALPALNYKGTTYLPLKGIGDVLGEPVKWNSDLKRVEVGKNVETNVPVETHTPSGDSVPIDPSSIKSVFQNYKVVIKMNNELYNLMDPMSFFQDKEKNYYTNIGYPLVYFLMIKDNDYNVMPSTNPFIKGTIIEKSTISNYFEAKEMYLDISHTYSEGKYSNLDDSVSYPFSTNPNNRIGNIDTGSDKLIPIKDFLDTFKIKYKIEVDDTNKLITWSFD